MEAPYSKAMCSGKIAPELKSLGGEKKCRFGNPLSLCSLCFLYIVTIIMIRQTWISSLGHLGLCLYQKEHHLSCGSPEPIPFGHEPGCMIWREPIIKFMLPSKWLLGQLSEYRKHLGMSKLKNIYRKCQPKPSHKRTPGFHSKIQRFKDSKITDIEVTLQHLKPWPNSVALAWHGSTQVCDLFVKPSNNLPKQTSLMSKIYCINSNLEKWWHIHGIADIIYEISADFWFPNMPSSYDWVFGTKTSPVLKVKRMAWRATARATTSFT